MKTSNIIPRILKINNIQGLRISVVYNTGESRVIDFQKVLHGIEITTESPAYILFDEKEFAKVKLEGNTLSWDNVEQFITLPDGSPLKVPFEIGADILLKYSELEPAEFVHKIGKQIKEMRLKSGLTQRDLAIKSGTSRFYISQIENDKSDLELVTLKQIIEVGLGKKLEIKIK